MYERAEHMYMCYMYCMCITAYMYIPHALHSSVHTCPMYLCKAYMHILFTYAWVYTPCTCARCVYVSHIPVQGMCTCVPCTAAHLCSCMSHVPVQDMLVHVPITCAQVCSSFVCMCCSTFHLPLFLPSVSALIHYHINNRYSEGLDGRQYGTLNS